MKEHPILMNSAMVRATLAGSKTQTRRIINPQPQMVTEKRIEPWQGDPAALRSLLAESGRKCPYGQHGEQIWVRETFAIDDDGYVESAVYRADGMALPVLPATRKPNKWRPSIHMPRWASRILLEIVSVRVERLNDCSEADALAEGISTVRTHEWDAAHFPEWRRYFDEACARGEKPPVGPMPSQAYAALWEEINGAGSWAANPWVWVIEFKRVAP